MADPIVDAKAGIRLPSGVLLLPIPEAPCPDYMAGDDGMIYSRTRYAGFGRKHYVDWYPLKPGRGTRGYFLVCLCHQNKSVSRTIHRLVCSAFHGAPESKSMQVRHLDGNRENNRPENLAWGTRYENWADRKAHGRGCEGEKHHCSQISDEERRHVAWAIKRGLCSQNHAARMLGVSPAVIAGAVAFEAGK